MRILFVEGNFDHHSLPLARCLHAQMPDGHFAYAAVRPLPEERRTIGWCFEDDLPWMIPVWRSNEDAAAFHHWWQHADIVICSQKQLRGLMAQRVANKQHVFYTSERWFRPPLGRSRCLHPQWMAQALPIRQLAHATYFHYLAIGTHAAADMRWFAAMPARIWHWAYFTAPSTLRALPGRKPGCRLLWAGRMLRLKRVDSLILACAELVQQQEEMLLTLVGGGPEKERLVRLAARCLPEHSYTFIPPVTPLQVREIMQRSDIYVLPSTGAEGWGAVINEAMSEGCAIVAADEIGAAKSLIEDRVSGMLFPSGDWQRLAAILCELACDEALLRRVAQSGKETIEQLWSPSTGAGRFLAVAEALLSQRPLPVYPGGPMQQL